MIKKNFFLTHSVNKTCFLWTGHCWDNTSVILKHKFRQYLFPSRETHGAMYIPISSSPVQWIKLDFSLSLAFQVFIYPSFACLESWFVIGLTLTDRREFLPFCFPHFCLTNRYPFPPRPAGCSICTPFLVQGVIQLGNVEWQ